MPFYKKFTLQKEADSLFFLHKIARRITMNENNKSTANYRRKSRIRRGYSFTSSSYAFRGCDEYDCDYRLQVTHSIGLENDYNHPDIEMLINFNRGEHGNRVLEDILYSISTGKQYKAGDRETIMLSDSRVKSCVVEFRESESRFGKCLRAVVLGMEEEFQSLPTEKALEYIHRLRDTD